MSNPWEAIARSANWIWNEIEGPFGDFRDGGVRSELEVILGRLVGSRPDDLPALAVILLVDAWLTAARDGDPLLFCDDDDAEDAPRP
jgi:hypothetical protein